MTELEIFCPRCGYPMDEIDANKENEFNCVCDYCGTEINGNFNIVIKNLDKNIKSNNCIDYPSLPFDSKLRIAYETGYDEGKEDEHEYAYNDGYEEGFDDGKREAKKEMTNILSVIEFEKIDYSLKRWRNDRNIKTYTQKTTFIKNMCEEIEEFYTKGLDYDYSIKDEYEYIDALSDMVVIIMNSFQSETNNFNELSTYICDNDGIRLDMRKIFFKDELNNSWDKISANGNVTSYDIYNFLERIINTMYYSGYNPYEVLNETIYEISDRTQDPIQKEKWDDMRNKGIPIEEKWEKDKDPEVQKTWYKANYFKALR